MAKTKKTKYTLGFETQAEANAFIRGLEFRSLAESVKSAYYEQHLGILPFEVRFTLERFDEVTPILKEKGII